MRLRAGGSALAGGLAAGAAYAVGSAQHSQLVSMVRGGSGMVAWLSRTVMRLSAVRELYVCDRVLNRHVRACALVFRVPPERCGSVTVSARGVVAGTTPGRIWRGLREYTPFRASVECN